MTNESESLDANQPIISAPSAGQRHAQAIDWIMCFETACGGFLLLIIFICHYQMMSYGGGLWRDEINTFNMASMESLGDIIKNLEYDSFPILWMLIVRGWIFAGLGSATGLRILGLIVGLGGTLSLIWACRTLGSRFSLVGLVLLYFCCPAAYSAGDSLRAYGCGMMLMFLTLGFLWKAVKDPSLLRVLCAGLLAVLSVQCVYYNSVLLFAMGMGGVAVGLRNRDFKKIAVVIGIGAAAALSLIPYWGAIKRLGSWNIIFHFNFTVSWMMEKFRETVEPAGAYVYWLWLALPLIAMVVCTWWFKKSKKASSQEQDRMLFVFTTLVVAIVGYAVFLKVLSYPTQPWYYISIIALMAATLDAAADLWIKARPAGRIMRLICVLIIMATTYINTWNAVHIRRTNMDILTVKLESISVKNDLIVVNPFYFGIPFEHYYKGDAPWVTLPPITDHRLHRYDLFKEKMTETEPLVIVHDQIQKTLQAGNRVWVIGGGIYFLKDGESPGELPPAPHSPYGWSEGAYSDVWWRQTAYLIQQHATNAGAISIDYKGPISPYENAQLFVFQGWRSQEPLSQ